MPWNATEDDHIETGCGGEEGDGTDGDPASTVTVGGTTVTQANPDGTADNMTGAQKDEAECSTDDNGGDQDAACDAELVMDFPILFKDGTFGCEATVDVTVTCTWDATADTGIDSDTDGTTGNEFSADDAVVGAKCEVEVN